MDRPLPLVRAVVEAATVAAAAPPPMAPPAAGHPHGATGPVRQLPSGGERPAIPQEQIVLPGESNE